MAERARHPGAQPDLGQSGLSRLPAERYAVGKDVARSGGDPGALGRHARDGRFRASVRAIGRAGAGTNNIPVEAMSAARRAGVQRAGRQRQRGEGAGARRHAARGAQPRAGAALRRRARHGDDADLDKAVEDGKKAFAGFELPGQTLGIIGLGKIGCLVADAAIKLGMNVLGYDPDITVDAAWSLPSQVQQGATSVDEVLQASALRDPARAAARRDAPPGQRRQHRPDAARRGAAQLLARGRGRRRARCSTRWPRSSSRWYVCDFPERGAARPAAA